MSFTKFNMLPACLQNKIFEYNDSFQTRFVNDILTKINKGCRYVGIDSNGYDMGLPCLNCYCYGIGLCEHSDYTIIDYNEFKRIEGILGLRTDMYTYEHFSYVFNYKSASTILTMLNTLHVELFKYFEKKKISNNAISQIEEGRRVVGIDNNGRNGELPCLNCYCYGTSLCNHSDYVSITYNDFKQVESMMGLKKEKYTYEHFSYIFNYTPTSTMLITLNDLHAEIIERING